MQEITFLRGGYNYKVYLGIDESGDSVDYIDRLEMDEETGYPVRYFPETIVIKRDSDIGKGSVKYIETTYVKAILNSDGNPISRLGEYLTFRTNNQDIKTFIAGFGIPIMMSGNNGFIRAILGFNEYPLFNPTTGQPLIYSTEDLSQEPTFTYYDSDTTNP